MHKNYKKILGLVALWLPVAVWATPMADYSFKSPSFNGSGYGTYALTIENEQYTRQQAVLSAIQSAQQAAASAASNQPINQFLTNLESRIYAQISQNVATAMFANGSCSGTGSACGGTINFQGNTLSWGYNPSDPNMINLNVKDSSGNTTVIQVPLNSFQMP